MENSGEKKQSRGFMTHYKAVIRHLQLIKYHIQLFKNTSVSKNQNHHHNQIELWLLLSQSQLKHVITFTDESSTPTHRIAMNPSQLLIAMNPFYL